MKRLLIFIMLILSIGLVSAIPDGATGDWIIDGNKVYIDDENVYISAEPHTAWNQYVEVSLMTKSYSGNINVLFGFDTDTVTPKYPEYFNPTEQTDPNGTTYTNYWQELTGITKITRNFNGKDTWYMLQDVPITANIEEKIRFFMETYSETKYDIIAYPSSYGSDIVSAYNNNHLYILDPWTGAPPIGGNAYYDFEDSATPLVLDDLWSSNDGSVSGMTFDGTTYPTFGTSGSGADYSGSFDGTDDSVLFSVQEFSITDDFTISAWVKIPSLGQIFPIIQNTEDKGDTYFYMNIYPSNTLQVGIEGTTTTATAVVESISTISADTWYHMVYINNGTENKGIIYIDGNYDNEESLTTTGRITSTGGWSMGARYFQDGTPGYDTYGEGNIDEVKIYSRALTPTEIENLYNYGVIEPNVTEPINLITKYYGNGTVSDNFFTGEDINYTVNNTINRTCNITLYDRPVEITQANNNFTVCDTGCDYSTYQINITHNHTDDPIDMWTFSGNLCHYNPATSATLTLSCGIESESQTIPASELTNCETGTVFRTANFSICNGTDNITIEVTSNANTYLKRLQVYNFTIGEEYINLTNLSLTISGNESYLDERIHYHTEGIKQSYVQCSDGVNDTHNITVTDIEPFLIKNRLDTDCYTEFYNASFDNFTFEYCSSDYVFNDIIQYGGSIYWEYDIICNDQLITEGNGTTYSVVQTLNESSVTDFLGSTELECYKNVTIFNLMNVSDIYYFLIDDTVYPQCTGFDNVTVDELGFYSLDYSCYDQNINSFNLTCSDLTDTDSEVNLSIGDEWYNGSLSLTISENITCTYSVCDGHPDDFNCIDGNFTIGYVAPLVYNLETDVCPVASTGLSILFSTLCILSFLLLLLGITLNNAIFTTISGIMFMILAFSLYGCSVMVGAVFIFIGIFLLITGLFRQPYR